EAGEVDGHGHTGLRRREVAGLRAAGRRARSRRDPRRPPVHHAGGRARLDLRAPGPERRPAADALRAARVAVREPALLPAGESRTAAQQGPAGRSVCTGRRRAGRGGLSLRRDDVPPDRAPHGRRHVALRRLPVRAAAADVRRGASRARRGARARERRLGDDQLSSLCDRSACARHGPHETGAHQRRDAPSGRPAVSLGNARAHDRRRSQRPFAHGARSERAHPGGQGVLVRHPSRPAAEGPRAPRRGRGKARAGAARRAGRGDGDDMSAAFETYADERVTYGDEAKPRMGFFTDTSVCIGCKACEVACKEWNLIPEDGLVWTGESYDNTSRLSANTWRHVAFIEQRKPLKLDGETASVDTAAAAAPLRWLMESDVCKHCTHAGCLDACPTGALFRTEFGTVVVQEDVCNGCGYCVPACPFGVIDKRDLPRSAADAPLALPLLGKKEDGRVWKCTLCYDRLKGGHEPACAKACPTNSIQFGEVDELRERAEKRLAKLQAERWNGAQLYGHDPNDGVGGF